MTFIEEIKHDAQSVGRENHILPSLMIAQACLESGYGKSGLARDGHNLFGVKGSYNGSAVKMGTTEYRDGHPYHTAAEFRKYPSWRESFEDLAKLYRDGVSWDHARYHGVIGETDIRKACHAVQEAGYATDPHYADKLLAIVQKEKLTQYDQEPQKEKAAQIPFPGHNLEIGVNDTLNVERVQRALNNAGAGEHLTVDGAYGPLTKAAVERYQERHKLAIDGIVGPNTWKEMF